MKISCAMAVVATGIMATIMVNGPALADIRGPGGKMIDCYCTDKGGGRIELGETICLRVDGTSFMAQCQMSLNVPMWRKVQEGCATDQMSQLPDPLVDPGLVDPQI